MIRKLLLTVFILVGVHSQTLWAAPEFAPDHPERYTVVKGDTLWDISSRFLKSPWLWPEVWHANPQIANPHLIYPGDVIGLVYIDGERRITTLQAGPNNGVTKMSPSDGAGRSGSDGSVKLSPKVRATPISTAIPTIPLEAIASFLSNHRIVSREELEGAPYILAARQERLITGAGDEVFARGLLSGSENVAIYRESQSYLDPDTGEFLGLEAKSIATAKVRAVEGDVLTLNIERSSEELRQGDRLLATEDRTINSRFLPSRPDTDIRGQMIAVDSGVRNIGQFNVVVINRGEREGIKEGHVLAAFKKGGVARDPITSERVQLPAERAGLLMVFRVFDKISYGLILQATRPLTLMDEVRTP